MVLVPRGVALATIAGMPPECGLYAAVVPVRCHSHFAAFPVAKGHPPVFYVRQP